MYALLVGIDQYKNRRLNNLKGCVNDAQAMAQLLQARFNVPADNIKILTNEQATHSNIKAAFRTHLIDNAQAWVDAGSEGDPPAFLFHYCGHGSQALDTTGTEPDGLDETIVPYDSRTENIYDIKDWELGQLLDELTEKFVDQTDGRYRGNVTVILDSCHSGSGTREAKDDLLPSRRCEPDLRPQPTQRPIIENGQTRGSTKNESGWLRKTDRYVLLAACRDREEANEYLVTDGEKSHYHGIMTYFLIQALARMHPGRRLTYQELHEQVRYKVNNLFKNQMPQCEGGRQREIFGGLYPARDIFLTVVAWRGSRIVVEGGVAHGLTVGSELHLYPQDSRTVADAGDPIATLQVRQVGAVQSECVLLEGDPAQVIPLTKAVIYRLDSGSMQRRVVLDVTDTELATNIQSRLAEDDLKHYVQLVPSDSPADFRIQQVEEQILHLQDGSGQRLVAPFYSTSLDKLAHDLAHLIRYKNALELQNTAPNGNLNGRISIDIKRVLTDIDPKTDTPKLEPLERTTGGDLVIETGMTAVVEIANHSSNDLFFALLDFKPEWDISLVNKMAGMHETLGAGKTVLIPDLRDYPEGFEFSLKGTEIVDARETFKVIVTLEEADYDILTQSPLQTESRSLEQRRSPLRSTEERKTRHPLNDLFDLAMQGKQGSRDFGPKQPTIQDEWTTTELTFSLYSSHSYPRLLFTGSKT